MYGPVLRKEAMFPPNFSLPGSLLQLMSQGQGLGKFKLIHHYPDSQI